MMITKENYDFLIESLSLKTNIQTNYYYSTNNSKFAMRIREIDDSFIFTLKEKQDGYKNEYEFSIKDNSLNDERITELLSRFSIQNPVYEGLMKTTRSIMNMKYGEFCLDKSEYLGITDYEIEYELYDASIDNNDEFMDLLKNNNLIYKESEKSKYGRFVEAKKWKLE